MYQSSVRAHCGSFVQIALEKNEGPKPGDCSFNHKNARVCYKTGIRTTRWFEGVKPWKHFIRVCQHGIFNPGFSSLCLRIYSILEICVFFGGLKQMDRSNLPGGGGGRGRRRELECGQKTALRWFFGWGTKGKKREATQCCKNNVGKDCFLSGTKGKPRGN